MGLFSTLCAAPPRHPEIKLVVSDFDGTLIPEAAMDISAEALAMIRQIQAWGMRFVAATGRQYRNVRALLDPVAEDVYFMTENGTSIIRNAERLLYVPIPDRDVKILNDAICAIPGNEPVFSSEHGAYIYRNSRLFEEVEYEPVYYCRIDRFDEIDEKINKVSRFCMDGVAPEREFFVRRFADPYHAAVSGEHWQDFTLADKGGSLARVMQWEGATADQVLCFGDNWNDIGMLRLARYSYAAENAPGAVKAVCGGTFRSVPESCARFFGLIE